MKPKKRQFFLVVFMLYFIMNILLRPINAHAQTIIQSTNEYLIYRIIIGCLLLLVIILLFALILLCYKLRKRNEIISKAILEEERYKVASELANDILFEYDVVTDTMWNAEKYQDFFGRTPKIYHFVERMKELDYIHQEDLSVFEQYCEALRFGKEKLEAEFRVLDQTGQYVWCHIRGKTIFNEKNKPIKVIGKIVNIDIQKRELEKLQNKAQRDPLTNVLNKGATKDAIDYRIKNSKRNEKHALMLLDIDDFKQINDTHGHLLGDKVLHDVIKQVVAMFRDSDIIGRIGGDEFVVFMTNVSSRDEVKNKADHLCKAFLNTYFGEDEELLVSGSVGISIYPIDGSTYNELLGKADKALYEVKNSGKNDYHIFEE